MALDMTTEGSLQGKKNHCTKCGRKVGCEACHTRTDEPQTLDEFCADCGEKPAPPCSACHDPHRYARHYIKTARNVLKNGCYDRDQEDPRKFNDWLISLILILPFVFSVIVLIMACHFASSVLIVSSLVFVISQGGCVLIYLENDTEVTIPEVMNQNSVRHGTPLSFSTIKSTYVIRRRNHGTVYPRTVYPRDIFADMMLVMDVERKKVRHIDDVLRDVETDLKQRLVARAKKE